MPNKVYVINSDEDEIRQFIESVQQGRAFPTFISSPPRATI